MLWKALMALWGIFPPSRGFLRNVNWTILKWDMDKNVRFEPQRARKTMGYLSWGRFLYWRIHGISYIWMSQNAKTKIYQSCRRHSWLLQAKVLSAPPMQPMEPILHVHSMLWNEDIWNLKSETSDVWIRTGHLYKAKKKAPPPMGGA